MKNLFNILFDENDYVFVAPDLYKGEVILRDDVKDGQYYCLNAVKPNTGRKLEDISKFRNFLIEMDKFEMDFNKKWDYVVNEMGIPFSACIYSGNKSLHFVVSLENPLADAKTYNLFAQWLKNIFKNADSSCLQPQKLTRFPNGMNKSTGKIQEVREIRERISDDVFLEWLNKYQNFKPVEQKPIVTQNQYQDRSYVVKIMTWYITEYLKDNYTPDRKYRCPICAANGKDNHHDNMHVYGDMKFSCFAVWDHNKLIFREVQSLYYQYNK